MADNYLIDIVCDRKEVFEGTFKLAFAMRYQPKAFVEYWLVKNKKLIFFSYVLESDKPLVQQFPCKLGVEATIIFAWEWLQQQEYYKQPDHDGDNKKGFHIFTNSEPGDIWFKPAGFDGAILALEPEWCMYGK